MNRNELIKSLQLQAHPEGGFYKETYRSEMMIFEGENNSGFNEARNVSTAIYFLIERDNFSALHRIKSDEIWHFYTGDPLEVIEITPQGQLIHTMVGSEIDKGQVFQYVVKAGHWFGSRVLSGGDFSFVGCTVAPGFDFRDFEMGERDQLIHQFPEHSEIIQQMTRV